MDTTNLMYSYRIVESSPGRDNRNRLRDYVRIARSNERDLAGAHIWVELPPTLFLISCTNPTTPRP